MPESLTALQAFDVSMFQNKKPTIALCGINFETLKPNPEIWLQ